MDRQRFDDLARALAAATPRRSLLGLAAALAWGAGAEARPGRRGRVNREDVPPRCRNGAADPAGSGVDCGGPCGPCPVGAACKRDDDCSTGRCCAGACADCKDEESCNLVDPAETGRCCLRDSPCKTCATNAGAAWVVDNCGHRVNCRADFLACPQPPDSRRANVNACCADERCACDGACCADTDACFVAVDPLGRPVGAFCCAAAGGELCGAQCCTGGCDLLDSGCLTSEGRLGSYRR